MSSGPSTPTQDPTLGDEDAGGPGLFSGEKNLQGTMEQETSSRTLKRSDSDVDANGQEETDTSGQGLHPMYESDQRKVASGMMPPPRPEFSATPTSGQAANAPGEDAEDELESHRKRVAQRNPETPVKQPLRPAKQDATRKRGHGDIDQTQAAGEDGDPSDSFSDPANTIATFDWMDLQSRYHQQMQQYHAEEQEIYRSFEELCGYFSIWAQAGQSHEVDRSFKRLKTQVTLVRHHETELEEKRQHYVKVVDAFKTVARILDDTSKAALASTRQDAPAISVDKPTFCSHATAAEAYDWDTVVHPSRCVIL